MMPSNAELKNRARESLLGHYPVVIGSLILFSLIMEAANLILYGSGSTLFSVLTLIVLTFFSSILETGIAYICLNLARNRRVSVKDLFHGIQHRPDRLSFIILLLMLVNFAVIVPFTLIAVFILPSPGAGLYKLPVIVFSYILWFALLVIALFMVNSGFVFAVFLHLDEENLSAAGIMKKSRQMMHGRLPVLAGLLLSFIGYALLGIASLGLGFLWIIPYLLTTLAHFYLSLR